MAYLDVARYEGSWCHGIIHGHFKYQWPIDSGGCCVYEGDFKNNEKHGKGIMRQADGSVWYEGEYKQGIPHGLGTLYYPNGAIYQGSWKDGKRDETGKYRYCNGYVYKGEWTQDKKHGYGIMICANGQEHFAGQWVDNKRHGRGSYKFGNGEIITGEWINDENPSNFLAARKRASKQQCIVSPSSASLPTKSSRPLDLDDGKHSRQEDCSQPVLLIDGADDSMKDENIGKFLEQLNEEFDTEENLLLPPAMSRNQSPLIMQGDI